MACQNLFPRSAGESVSVRVVPQGNCVLRGVHRITDCNDDLIEEKPSYDQQQLEAGIEWVLEPSRNYILRILRSPASCALVITHVFPDGEVSDECPGGDELVGSFTVSTC